MKLKEVEVLGLYGGHGCSLSLNESGVTFLHSLNGTGKSTVLRMVDALFAGDEGTLEDVPFSELKAVFYDGMEVTARKDHELGFIISANGSEDRVGLKDIAGLADILYIPPERTAVNRDGKLLPAISECFDEFGRTYGEAKADTELGEPKRLMAEDDDRFIDVCLDLKAKLEYIGGAGLSVRIPSDIKFPPSRYELSQDKERYVYFVSSLSEWIDGKYRFAESVNVYLDVVNGLFRNKRADLDERGNFRMTANGVPIPSNGLSAGEKQILIMFYRLLFHAKDGSIVFIDEPEISLHVSWQQALGSIFQDVCRMRDIQMLVATHSPQIIHDKWDLATEMRSDLARIPRSARHSQYSDDGR